MQKDGPVRGPGVPEPQRTGHSTRRGPPPHLFYRQNILWGLVH